MVKPLPAGRSRPGLKADEDVVVWVTDDDNRIPVYIEAKILVGTVKAYLKETKGLRNPVTSIVK